MLLFVSICNKLHKLQKSEAVIYQSTKATNLVAEFLQEIKSELNLSANEISLKLIQNGFNVKVDNLNRILQGKSYSLPVELINGLVKCYPSSVSASKLLIALGYELHLSDLDDEDIKLRNLTSNLNESDKIKLNNIIKVIIDNGFWSN